MALRVAAVGEIVEDRYLDASDRETRHLGGISCNFGRSAMATGAEVTLFSAVGTDDAGARLLHALPLHSRVRTLPGETASQRIRVKPNGEREFCGFRAGVLTDYALSADDLARVSECDVVHVPIQPETEHLFTQVRPHARALVADFSIDSATGDDPRQWCGPHLQALSVAFIGGSTRHVEPLLSLGRLIVLTCGADGAYALHNGRALHQPTLATRIVDTTGCGDAFAGAFTVAHFTGASLQEALAAGARSAAATAARLGA